MTITCPCAHCHTPIEFDALETGEEKQCPGCEQFTKLFIPNSPVKLPAGFARKKPGAGSSPAIPSSFLWILLGLALFFGIGVGISEGPAQGILIALGIPGMLCLYFLPAAVAWQRHKKNFQAIFILNLFAGWTFIGWLIALIWAMIKD